MARNTRTTATRTAQTDAPTDAPETAQTDAQTDGQTDAPEDRSGLRGADAQGSGRKAVCNADMGEAGKCALWLGHADADGNPTPHDSLDISDDDLESEFMAEDEIADVVVSPAVRDKRQLKVDADLDKNYQEWVRRGSDTAKPVWSKYTVQRAKARKIRSMLRNAADHHDPKIQVRISDKFIAGDQTVIAYAGMKRREYDNTKRQANAAAAAADSADAQTETSDAS